MLFRNGTHLLDMICFFAEAEPEWVVAELEPGFDHFTEYKGDGGKIPETEPSASAYIRFSKGIRAFYNGYKVKFPASQFILICEDGKLEVSDRGAQIIRGSSHLNLDYSPLLPESYMLQQKGALVAELIHVLEHGGDLVSPGCDARMTLELLLGILKSHENGNNRVNFPL